jgi:peptidyl-prolyl cis-trans isomerase B (cyclophilin B)
VSLSRTTPIIACFLALAPGSAMATLQQSAADAGGCARAARPAPRKETRKPPKQALDSGKHYDVTLVTNCGSFTIRLDVRHSPHTTASFVSLVRSHYFDRTIFHRIVPGFVIQGGDPTQTGTSGPGYSTVDRPPTSTRYAEYTVAMAKTQLEAPGTSGSQFFVVTGPAVQLPPDYALLGKVYVGRKVVDAIGKLGNPQTELPTQVIEIVRATVEIG